MFTVVKIYNHLVTCSNLKVTSTHSNFLSGYVGSDVIPNIRAFPHFEAVDSPCMVKSFFYGSMAAKASLDKNDTDTGSVMQFTVNAFIAYSEQI